MQSTSSVSQGTFLFLPDGFTLSKIKKTKKRKIENLVDDKWEKAFNKIWRNIDKELKEINEELFDKVLEDLVRHIKQLHNDDKLNDGILPCEILLTGTNLPDHKSLLSALIKNLQDYVTPYTATLWSRDCGNLKNAVHHLVEQIIPRSLSEDIDSDDDESDKVESNLISGIPESKVSLQVSQLTLSTLTAWHSVQCKAKGKIQPLIIILPDFEGFLPNVLGEFILLLSSYSSKIPIVLVFGVATTPVAVYQSLPRNVLSQLVIQLFRSEPSTSFLNHVIENIFFSEKCPFRLGSKCMTFLTDLFLFHSFSVQGFIQGFKFCMIEHFFKRDHLSLCCASDDLEEQADILEATDLEDIRKLSSFQKHVEASSKEDRKLLLLDDEHTKNVVVDLLKELQEYTSNFHVVLKCLHVLTQDLPQAPLGRHVRELYCKAVSSNIKDLSEYKTCIKLLHLQSRSELTVKINLLLELLKINSLLDILSMDKSTKFDDIMIRLQEFKKQLDLIGTDSEADSHLDYEVVRQSLLDYIESEIVEKLLKPPTLLPLHEIIYFDDLVAVRRRISGSPRGAIHMALNSPHYYLECKCCNVPNPEGILPTFPDLSVAYKLHLECNKIINLYDWLQAFAVTVNPNKETEGEVDQEIQARFTRAVSELQFLGFIKPSRAKADHVSRLTWGNS